MDKVKALLEKLQWSYVVLIIAVAAAFFYFMLDQSDVEGKQQSVELVTSEISGLEKKINEAKEFERQFDDKKRKYAELAAELQKQQGALPRQLFLPDLLTDLLKEAKQLEIDVTLIRADEREKSEELFNSLGFTVEARGTFLQFFIFLDRLAHMKRLLTLDVFSIEKDAGRPSVTLGGEEGAFANSRLSGGRASYPGVRATLRVLTYRYKAPATSAAAPAGAKK